MTISNPRILVGASLVSSSLSTRLHHFPIEASVNSFKQSPVVEPLQRFARLYINSQPAALGARVGHNLNSTNVILASANETEIIGHVAERHQDHGVAKLTELGASLPRESHSPHIRFSCGHPFSAANGGGRMRTLDGLSGGRRPRRG